MRKLTPTSKCVSIESATNPFLGFFDCDVKPIYRSLWKFDLRKEGENYSVFRRYYYDVISSVRDKFPQSAGNPAPSSSAPSRVSPLFPVLSGVYRPVCPWTWATRTTPAWLDNPGPSSTPEIEQRPVASSGQQPPPVNLSFPAVPRILLLVLKQCRKYTLQINFQHF